MSKLFTALMGVLASLPSPVMELKTTKQDKADQAARDRRVRSMRNHRPTTIHRHKDGTAYRVAPSGAWIRVTGRACEIRKGCFVDHRGVR